MPRGRSYQVLTFNSPFLTLGSAKHITSAQADISLAIGEYHACEASISLFSLCEKTKKARPIKRRTENKVRYTTLLCCPYKIIRSSLTQKLRVGLRQNAFGNVLRGDLIQPTLPSRTNRRLSVRNRKYRSSSMLSFIIILFVCLVNIAFAQMLKSNL